MSVDEPVKTERERQRDVWVAAGCSKIQLGILELRHWNGFSIYQIADATDKSVSTVRGHLRAAERRVELYHREAA